MNTQGVNDQGLSQGEAEQSAAPITIVELGGAYTNPDDKQIPYDTQKSLDLLDDIAAAAIHNAFLLGSSLLELKSRVRLETLKSAKASQSSKDPQAFFNDDILEPLIKVDSPLSWRGVFNRIAIVHGQCFTNSSTENTLYARPLASDLPHLYPSKSSMYSSALKPSLDLIEEFVGFKMDKLGQELQEFKLYDVTRRALNCLTLLYTKPQDTLISEQVSTCQQWIIHNLPKTVQQFRDITVLNQPVDPIALNGAIQELSFQTATFLDAWDGYLRENFYAGGRFGDNEFELIAYEAGRSLSALSWNISLQCASLKENQLDQIQNNWKTVFTETNINTIQRQISSLSATLDDAYYRVKGNTQPPKTGERPSSALPSQGIHAVAHSLAYWQRAVAWLFGEMSRKLTITGADSSPSVETVKLDPDWDLLECMRLALVSQAGIWQSLVLCEQNLKSFTTGSVSERILNELMRDFEKVYRQQITATEEGLVAWLKRPASVVLAFATVIFIIVLVILLILKPNSFITIFTFSAGVITAGLAWLGNIFRPAPTKQSPAATASDNTNASQRLSNIFSMASGTLFTTFQNGYKQVLFEFDDLNRQVAITYPLIDFFIYSVAQKGQIETRANESTISVSDVLKDAYDFLSQIIWTQQDRQEQVLRVARAAFGPLGWLLGPDSSAASDDHTNDSYKVSRKTS